MNLDLHLHSTTSDGQLPPAQVVEAAVKGRLDVIALTDHDTVAGVEAAMEAARNHPIQVIPALEASTTWDETELHILGYFVDPSNPRLRAHDDEASRRRRERLQEMVNLLQGQGVEVTFDQVLAQAAGEVSSLGRPHLARALHAAGYVDEVAQAFDRYIGNEHPAYIPTRLLDPAAAIEMIHGAGGLAIWAHPPIYLLESGLPALAEMGLDGVEIYRPRNSPDRTKRIRREATAVGLDVFTGGSDWHGPDDGVLGEFVVQSQEVSRFLELGGM